MGGRPGRSWPGECEYQPEQQMHKHMKGLGGEGFGQMAAGRVCGEG